MSRAAITLLRALSIMAPGAPASAAAAKAKAPRAATDRPFWTGKPDPATFAKLQDQRLEHAQQAIDRMLAVRGARTIENTLRPYDDAMIELDAAGNQAGLIEETHPDSGLRAAAEQVSQKVSKWETELSLNRKVYDALVALDLSKTDPATRFYVEKELRDFRMGGVDKDEATREQVKRLNEQLVEVGQQFSKNIRAGTRSVTVKDTSELAGLPADYIARHKPAADGTIRITTEYPDAVPVLTYARNEDLRRRLYMEYNNRAFPANMAVIDSLVAKRHRLATLLGFASWAELITSNKMIGSPKNASEFIDKIVEASGPGAQREYQMLLQRKQKDVPGAAVIQPWETNYYSELVRRSEYDFDAQSMRPYFSYDRVKQGVLDVTSRMFDVTYRQVKDAPVVHPSVECYEMIEKGKVIGRFYLDMHPRPNKYSHAAHFRIRGGIKGRQIPESALVCNLPGGVAGEPGLMEQRDVSTFFHEFGHLLHSLFAGQQQWVGISGVRTERDFVEAPSQMLEEWMENPAVLATFARHYETKEPVPPALVKQMVRAGEFGKALGLRRQMTLARLSLSIYDRDPKLVNTDAMAAEYTRAYQPFPFVEGTHFQTAFGHLDGYSAVYYTYAWSEVIAKDLFSAFDENNLLDPKIATRYRNTVLAPGGTLPAAKLVENFIGRPFNFEAYRTWLNHVN
jgi:thimet oligopeptidase